MLRKCLLILIAVLCSQGVIAGTSVVVEGQTWWLDMENDWYPYPDEAYWRLSSQPWWNDSALASEFALAFAISTQTSFSELEKYPNDLDPGPDVLLGGPYFAYSIDGDDASAIVEAMYVPMSAPGITSSQSLTLTYPWIYATASAVETIVPVPTAVWLFGSALGFLACMRRKGA